MLSDVTKNKYGTPMYYDSFHEEKFNGVDFAAHCGYRDDWKKYIDSLVRKCVLDWVENKKNVKFPNTISLDSLDEADDFQNFVIKGIIRNWLKNEVADKKHISKNELSSLYKKIKEAYRAPKFIAESMDLNDCIRNEINHAIERETQAGINDSQFSELAMLENQRKEIDARIHALKNNIHED